MIELRRKLSTEILSYLEMMGVDWKPFVDYPKSLMLTFLMTLSRQHQTTPFIGDDELPFWQDLMKKTHEEAQVEYRRASEGS